VIAAIDVKPTLDELGAAAVSLGGRGSTVGYLIQQFGAA